MFALEALGGEGTIIWREFYSDPISAQALSDE